MSDREAIKKLQEKLKATLQRQAKIKTLAESAATEVEERERQERT